MSRTDKIFAEARFCQQRGRYRLSRQDKGEGAFQIKGYYDDAGRRMKFSCDLKNGRPHGVSLFWSETGQLRLREFFHKGILHGPRCEWTEQGVLISEIHFVNGAYHGRRREWYPHGQIKWECEYRLNQMHGRVVEWDPQGRLREQGAYHEGQRHGVWKMYDRRGRCQKREIYIRGVLLSGRLLRYLNKAPWTPQRIVRIRNAAVRRLCLEEIGWEPFLRECPSRCLDTVGESSLHRVTWHPDEEDLMLLKVRCPSTGSFYVLRVPPYLRRAQDAVAWTFQLSPEKYNPIRET